jgi:hypothetical protein
MQLKITLVLFIIILFVGMGSLQVQSQNLSLNIIKTDNTEQDVQLSLLKKITFVGTEMIFDYQSGTTENVAVSLIQKVTFGSFTALSSTFENEKNLVVYPNPSSDCIYLNNVPESLTNVAIYSINGIQVMNLPLMDKKIDISQLAKGIYFVKVNNQVSKFSKL